MTLFIPKDFIETSEGLCFAVVDAQADRGKVLCFLRYVNEEGSWLKKSTVEANDYLRSYHSSYLHYAKSLDAHLHAVGVEKIVCHHRPRERLQQILANGTKDLVECDLLKLCRLLQETGLELKDVGVTGSILLGIQNDRSDIDLVCYGREVFQHCRKTVLDLLDQGLLQELSDADWQESYRRRNCSLNYGDYVWHERRKYNKAMVNGRKFDLSLVDPSGSDHRPRQYRKIGPISLHCRILDDSRGFDYPAVFAIKHDSIDSIVCFTATYTGQVFSGEWVEVSGILEEDERGRRRIVVGSSREAHGEHIKMIDG